MGDTAEQNDAPIDVDLVVAQFDVLDSDTHRKALLEAVRARDVYRKLIDELKEKIAKLELGLIGPKRERFKDPDDSQLSLSILAELLGAEGVEGADAQALAQQLLSEVEAEAARDDEGQGGDGGGEDDDPRVHRKPNKRTGRRAAREDLPQVTFEVLPDEVKRLGLDAFDRIGEERSTTLERRIASLVQLTVVRPKFRAKTDEAADAVRQARAERGTLPEEEPQAWIALAPAPQLPIERGMAGPGLLANTLVRRFGDSLPYHRLEGIYEREGVRLGRSTIYGWHDALRQQLCEPLVGAMLADALSCPYLCIDATGVLVQAPEKCSRGHFWVLVAPGRHVLFAFSERHDSAAVDKLIAGYQGYVVADAHSVYDHLYGDDGATEAGCWGHTRSYFFKVLGSEPEIAREFLGNLRVMFLLERKLADTPRRQRQRLRQKKVKVLVDRHFELCRRYAPHALDGTPLAAAITYSTNQEQALRRFLDDGRLPATNNISERELKRQATGRKNWLFVASEDGGKVNACFTSLIASCQMHDIEPEAYLRDILCLLPDWPKRRILELAPAYWKKTREQPDTQQRLADNVFRKIILELDALHRPQP